MLRSLLQAAGVTSRPSLCVGPRPLSHCPSQPLGPSPLLWQTHCKSLPLSLCPSPLPVWPHVWVPWVLGEDSRISAPRTMVWALIPVLPQQGVPQVRGGFPIDSQADRLLFVLLGRSNPCVPVLGVHHPHTHVSGSCPVSSNTEVSGGVAHELPGTD